MKSPLCLILTLSALAASSFAEDDWPQGAGRSGDLATTNPAATEWSVVRDRNISWKITLPETGQNTPVVAEGKVFFSTLKPVEEDSALGKDIIAWCVDAESGEILWQRTIEGTHPLRLSGCFSDSSSPPAVCDGERVIFTNASGGIACFDLKGNVVWSKETLSAGRTLPFLDDGKFVFTRQLYPPGPDGIFPHDYADSPKEKWTQLEALKVETGEVVWTSDCGVNMGCVILPQTLSDGRKVAMVGRGGGHGPPEKPDGVSLVDLKDGSTIWTLPLEGFMATMSYRITENDIAPIFHDDEHLCLDALTGKILSRSSIIEHVPVRRYVEGKRTSERLSLPAPKKKRMITQGSNLLVGKWHYFRSYTRPWLGRVNLENGDVEYLELPLQLSRKESAEDSLLWFTEPSNKKDTRLEAQTVTPNDMKNSRGFVVFGDKRSQGSGWGHIASPSPTVAGDHLYLPVMNGTVYVLDWTAETLDESAIVAINDLGPAGRSYTRASLSFADGCIFAHTIRELVCIR
ncbi:MAG: PQQ-binding-like beta-propeller repeat protein [Verrucomicrobiales bacterium]|nr:PQQ-binding-like beta-propeller repeat protein [Verrucomicrobiales bacterium]